jgi:hypothetical protein
MNSMTRTMLTSALMMALAGGVYAQGGRAGGGADPGSGAGSGRGMGGAGGNADGAGGTTMPGDGAGTGVGTRSAGGMGTGMGGTSGNPSTHQSRGMNNSTRPNVGHGTNDRDGGAPQNGQ